MFHFYRENARWLLGGMLLTLFSAFGQTSFISIWGGEIREAYQLSHGEFGRVYMIATLASAMTLPVLGRLVDVTSVARSAVIVITMLALACLLMAVSRHVALLVLTIYLLRLFGQGMMTHTSMTAMGRWYVANRGKAVSLASIGHNCSEAVFPTLFVALALATSWRGAWYIAAGALMLVALPLIVALMRVERVARTKPGEISTENEIGRQWTRGEMLRDPLFWLACIGVFSPSFIGTSIFFHQDYLIETNGWDQQVYYGSFFLMAVTTVTTGLLTGFAIDRWGAIRMLPLFMLPLGGACLLLAYFSAPVVIFVFMVLFGFSAGLSQPVFGALWPEVYGTRHLGAMRSITVSFMVFMSAAGPGVTGQLIDWGVPFQQQLFGIALFCFATFALMMLAAKKMELRHRAQFA